MYPLLKAEKISEDSLDWIESHHLHWKFKLLAGKFTCHSRAKLCWVMSTNFVFLNVCWQCQAMFVLYTSSKLSCLKFEFSLKVKLMGANPSYLFKSFLPCVLSVYQLVQTFCHTGHIRTFSLHARFPYVSSNFFEHLMNNYIEHILGPLLMFCNLNSVISVSGVNEILL